MRTRRIMLLVPFIVAALAISARLAHSQSEPVARTKFDVASIKPCDPNAVTPGGRSAKGGSAARLRRNSVTVMDLIQGAYVRFLDGTARSPMLTSLTKIEGGPDWINSDRYSNRSRS